MTTTPVADKLRTAKESWEAMLPTLPDNVPVQNNIQIPKGALSDWFDNSISGVGRVEEGSPDPILKAIYWTGVSNAVNQIVSYMNTAKSQGAGWLQQNTTNIQVQLWTIRSSLVWLDNTPTDLSSAAQIPLLTELVAQADEIAETGRRASEAERTLSKLLSEVESAHAQAVELTEKVVGYERNANNSNTNAAASAQSAEAEKQRVDGYVSQLESSIDRQQQLFQHFEDKRADIEATLQGASRVALARSFEERRAALQKFQYFWAIVFLTGIVALTVVGAVLGNAVITQARHASDLAVAASAVAASAASTVVANSRVEHTDMLLSLLRFLVLAPVVWITWFAARQYSQTQRLGEDYAFKSAAAHAFVGYKEEMGDDSKMLELLREYAIRNFGANPIRVLAKNDPASPLHDLFEKVLDKVDPDKLVDLLKDWLPKSKG